VLDDLLDVLAEAGLVLAGEFFPRAQGARVLDAVDEEGAGEVVALVLVGAGCDAADDRVDRLAVAVPGLDAQLDVAADAPRRSGTDRQPSKFSNLVSESGVSTGLTRIVSGMLGL
jgi:hypothetical protein